MRPLNLCQFNLLQEQVCLVRIEMISNQKVGAAAGRDRLGNQQS